MFAFSDKRERERWLQEVRFQPESGDPWPDISFLYNLTVPLGNRVGGAKAGGEAGSQVRRNTRKRMGARPEKEAAEDSRRCGELGLVLLPG